MSRKEKKEIVPESPALGWLWGVGFAWAIVVCVFFYKHTPFSHFAILDQLFGGPVAFIPSFSALLDYASGVLFFILLAVSALFVGRLLLLRFNGWESNIEKFVFSAALGYAALAYAALALGAAGLLYRGVIQALVSALFIGALVWFWRPAERENLKALRSEITQGFFPGGAGTFLGLLLLFLLITDFVMAFVPELFYDALVYHLGVPNFYLQAHRIEPLHMMTAKFPFTIQMVHLLGLALKDEMVTKLTHVFFMALIAVGMLALGQRFKKRTLGVAAALLFCSIPTVQLNVWTSGVDLGVSLFGFLAFFAFFLTFEKDEPNAGWFWVCALFAGLAAASKYTSAYVPTAVGLATFAAVALKRIPFARAIKWLVVFSAIVAALLAPWLIKNWLETGNPVYPFLSSVFGGESLAPWRYEILRGENVGLRPGNIFGIPKMLWDLSIKERSSLSFQGPMFLACLPLAFAAFFRERPRSFQMLGVFVALACLLGLSMTRLTRYVLPAFATLACFLAYGLESYLSDKSFLRRMGVVLVVFLCFLQQTSWAYIIMNTSYRPQNVLIGRESRFDYVNRYHNGMNPNPSMQMYSHMEKNLTIEQKVLLVGEEKGYPLHARHTYSGVYDRGLLVRLSEEKTAPAEVAAALLDQGVTHVMINVYEANRLASYGILSMPPKAFGLLCAFWETHLKFSHVEFNAMGGNEKNALVLLEVSRAAIGPNDRSVQNVLAAIYERNELVRLGITEPAALRSFYEDRLKEWPQIAFFNNRVKELRSK